MVAGGAAAAFIMEDRGRLRGLRVVSCMWWAALAAALGAGAGAGAGGAPGRRPEPRPRCLPLHSCRELSQNFAGLPFEVKGIEVSYDYADSSFFSLECPPLIALDEPALPRFSPALRVRTVWLRKCWPRAGSYEDALRALNVTTLVAPGPGAAPAPPMYHLHLELEDARDLQLLADTPNLRDLTLSYMNLVGADLALLPAALERLELKHTAIGRVSAAALAHLPRLGELVLEDFEPVAVEAAGDLSSLVAISSATTLATLSLPDSLSELELGAWAERRPRPWRACAGLERLAVDGAAAEALPERWLAGCARLQSLRLARAANLTSLAAGALRGARALREVRLTASALQALPAGLLDDAPALRDLDLTGNRLHTLPGELFMNSRALSRLILSGNNLSLAALGALEQLGAAAGAGTESPLRVLRLEDNPALDACPPPAHADAAVQGLSPLRDLKSLTELSLSGTGTRRVCSDWRRLSRLRALGLARTRITRLTYADLQCNTTAHIEIDLRNTNVTHLAFSRADYESAAAAAAPAGPALTLRLNRRVRCDCELFWAAAVLRLRGSRLRVYGAVCEDGVPLDEVPPDELACAAPGAAACPAGCVCATRDDAARPARLLLLHCPGGALRSVPRVDARAALLHTGAEPLALDLRLAGNRIDRLDSEDLPPELVAIDLRNNSLGLIDNTTAATLVSRADRRVLLAHNPLNCSCRAATALSAMRAHPAVFQDWADATCSDGTPLALAAPLPCDDDGADDPKNVSDGSTQRGYPSVSENESEGMSRGAAVALALGAVVVALVLALALALARPSLRRRLRAALRAARLPRPLSVLRLERLDAGEWMYDVFVSFAHADEAIVRELVEELESGAAPLRLCVHYRDWMPGGWIPAQIAASVRVSRRTVAVVSEAFLRSKWARLEFREAYAAAMEAGEPRLVLVLLEDPARLPLDAELRVCVEGSTYVRWGDPWFWEKLRRALPAGAAAPAPAPAPPADD